MRKINSRNPKRLVRKSYSIVVDGQTEAWYLQMMRQEEKLQVNIAPELPEHKDLEALYETVLSKVEEGYDKVYWTVDFDVIIKESKVHKKGVQSSLSQFNDYYKKLKKQPKVEVLINNPCLEFWYLQHFVCSGRYYPKYAPSLERDLKKYMNDYEKTERYYKQANNIYKRLHPSLLTAIKNAKSFSDYDLSNPENPYAEMYRLVESLLKDK